MLLLWLLSPQSKFFLAIRVTATPFAVRHRHRSVPSHRDLAMRLTVAGLSAALLFTPRAHAAITLSTETASMPRVTTRPAELLLSPDFVISDTPTTRVFDWTISEMLGAPDGCKSIHPASKVDFDSSYTQFSSRCSSSTDSKRVHSSKQAKVRARCRALERQVAVLTPWMDEGDTIVVNVFNNASAGTAIHWHVSFCSQLWRRIAR